MSLKCIDLGMKRKLQKVFPNVYFGPLARALQKSASDDYKIVSEDYMNTTEDIQKVDIKESEVINEVAAPSAPNQYDQELDQHIVGFPMIAFDRINNPYGFEFRGNDPAVRRGWVSGPDTRQRALPVTPMYQIDIISDRREEVDEIWREVSMLLYVQPNVEVIYSEGTKEQFSELYPIRLLSTDNTTDVESFEELGIIYRQTISVQVTNAQLLFDKTVRDIKCIPIRLIYLDALDNEYVDWEYRVDKKQK